MAIPDEDKVFYHALYHHVTHWAAYIAMNGLLITIGFFLSLTPPNDGAHMNLRLVIIQFAVIVSFSAALYFTSGMFRYGRKLNESVPESYLKYYLKVPHNLMTFLQVVASLVCAVLDELLLIQLMCSKG
jgi:hypothetical protein